MKKTRIIYLLTVAMLLASCDTTDTDFSDRHDAVPLQIGSGISANLTRAFDTTWDIGDAIGVFSTVKGNRASITKSGSQNDENIPYQTIAEAETYTGGSYTFRSFSPVTNNKQIYLPADGSAVDIYAYYPYTNSAENPVSASVPLAISIPTSQTLANQKGIDVLKASLTSTTENPIDIDHNQINLMFNHVMSKVIVYVMAGTGLADEDLTDSKVSSVQLLGQPTTATFAPVSQELTITSGSATITMQEITDTTDPDYVASYTKYKDDDPETPDWTKNVLHVYRAIVLPNNESTNPATTGSERQIKFNVGDTNYTYNITQNLQSAQQTIFAMRLSATGLDVWATIVDWSHETITPNPLYPNEQQ